MPFFIERTKIDEGDILVLSVRNFEGSNENLVADIETKLAPYIWEEKGSELYKNIAVLQFDNSENSKNLFNDLKTVFDIISISNFKNLTGLAFIIHEKFPVNSKNITFFEEFLKSLISLPKLKNLVFRIPIYTQTMGENIIKLKSLETLGLSSEAITKSADYHKFDICKFLEINKPLIQLALFRDSKLSEPNPLADERLLSHRAYINVGRLIQSLEKEEFEILQLKALKESSHELAKNMIAFYWMARGKVSLAVEKYFEIINSPYSQPIAIKQANSHIGLFILQGILIYKEVMGNLNLVPSGSKFSASNTGNRDTINRDTIRTRAIWAYNFIINADNFDNSTAKLKTYLEAVLSQDPDDTYSNEVGSTPLNGPFRIHEKNLTYLNRFLAKLKQPIISSEEKIKRLEIENESLKRQLEEIQSLSQIKSGAVEISAPAPESKKQFEITKFFQPIKKSKQDNSTPGSDTTLNKKDSPAFII